ncbi:MAG: hypothetical protein M1836_005638 [Candelina mexicana]|nr:MAG: hypothetical protein M1836_005638 [Candelina mexicana]
MFGAQELCLAPGFILGKDSSETPINFEVETDIQEIPLSVENLAMSFGGPGGGQKAQKPTPPERGSFPLDHDGMFFIRHPRPMAPTTEDSGLYFGGRRM